MTRRYQLQPLADVLGISLASLGRHLGVSGSTWKEYRDQGVTEKVGDRLAVRAGVAAYEVWPEMLDHAIEDADHEDAEEQRRRRDARNARRRELYAANRQRVCAIERARYQAEITYRRKKAARRYQANAEIEKEKARLRRRGKKIQTSTSSTTRTASLTSDVASSARPSALNTLSKQGNDRDQSLPQPEKAQPCRATVGEEHRDEQEVA